MNRLILLLLAAVLQVQPACAQDDKPISPSAVLVLKLISATHVKPTTGIVVSEDGMVLVPADFVSTSPGLPDAEIVVLDGGTDILKNGRPAKIINRSNSTGFAVLSVKGLKRPGFKLADRVLDSKSKLHLAAFPPAELIAKGAQPLWVPLKTQNNDSGDDSALPYVSGPVIDECGYLAGFSLTHGPQSMETGIAPEIISADELNRILIALQFSLPTVSCTIAMQKSEPLEHGDQPVDDTARPDEPLLADAETNTPADEPGPAEAITPDEHKPVADKNGVGFDKGTINTSTRPSLWRSVPLWLPLLAFIVIAVLIWKAIFFFRINKIQPASEEPATSVLENDSDTASAKPRSAPVENAEAPNMAALPDGCDGIIVIDGVLGTDTRFKRFCYVNTQQFNVVIGRGEVDIEIEHPTISRNHARLERHAGIMTFSDLGSNNGTSINGIPCLPGEIMFIESEDEVFMGDVQIRIRMLRNEVNIS